MSLLLHREDISSVHIRFKDETELIFVPKDEPTFINSRLEREDNKPDRLEWEVRWTEKAKEGEPGGQVQKQS